MKAARAPPSPSASQPCVPGPNPMRLRTLAMTLTGIFVAGAIVLPIARLSTAQVELAAEISQFRASIADIPRVETYSAGLGDWKFTVLKDSKDGHTIAFTLTGLDLPMPQYVELPVPSRKPQP